LRPDAKFSDGSPLTAQQVVDNVGYWAMMAHSQAAGYRSNFQNGRQLFSDIVGLIDAAADAEYHEFGALPVPGVTAVDDHTVSFTLEKPTDNFILRLTYNFYVFKPEDMLAGNETEYDLLDYWPAHAVASGPYKIETFTPGASVTMVPNEQYFGPKPTIPKITLLWIEDPSTRLTAFANKELDAVTIALTGDVARQALADPYMQSAMVRQVGNQIHQFWVTPNVPLDDVHVRRAVSMAIDRDALLQIFNAGADVPLYVPVDTHTSPEVPSCQQETATAKMLPFDPNMAKEELAQSKYWPDVVDMEIHIYAANATVLPECEATQAMLQQNLGLPKVPGSPIWPFICGTWPAMCGIGIGSQTSTGPSLTCPMSLSYWMWLNRLWPRPIRHPSVRWSLKLRRSGTTRYSRWI
jgi:ABC-type transport system substrate-binding protein